VAGRFHISEKYHCIKVVHRSLRPELRRSKQRIHVRNVNQTKIAALFFHISAQGSRLTTPEKFPGLNKSGDTDVFIVQNYRCLFRLVVHLQPDRFRTRG
jgi:hypothetical protein